LNNTKQAQAMIKIFIQTIGKHRFTNWSGHFAEPYESSRSSTVPLGAWGENPLAYSTSSSYFIGWSEVTNVYLFISLIVDKRNSRLSAFTKL
jgi:hypothetical protein